ncbi:MAG: DUF4307 domain-containing protein [Actinobacteria bacterium]|nr:DUF4307 domain-containing protein [Actinomycetota bacterium]
MVHPKVFTDPILRERYGIKSNRRSNLWLAIGLSILALSWFIWSGSKIANPQIRSQVISFKIVDNQSISITYTLQVKDLNKVHTCGLVARDIDKNVVGEISDQIPAGQLIAGKNQRTILISTRTPAVNAGISSCQ